MSARNLRGPKFESLSVCGDLTTETICLGDELDRPTQQYLLSNLSSGFLMKTAEVGPNWTEFGQLSFSTKVQLIIKTSNHTYEVPSSTNISLQNTNTRSMINPNLLLNCCISLYVDYAEVTPNDNYKNQLYRMGNFSISVENRISVCSNAWLSRLDCTLCAEASLLVDSRVAGMIEITIKGINCFSSSKETFKITAELTTGLDWISNSTLRDIGDSKHIHYKKIFQICSRTCRRVFCSDRNSEIALRQYPAMEQCSCKAGCSRCWFPTPAAEFMSITDSWSTPRFPSSHSGTPPPLSAHTWNKKKDYNNNFQYPDRHFFLKSETDTQAELRTGQSYRDNSSGLVRKENGGIFKSWPKAVPLLKIPSPDPGLMCEQGFGLGINNTWVLRGELDFDNPPSDRNLTQTLPGSLDNHRSSGPRSGHLIRTDWLPDVDLLHQEADLLIQELFEQEKVQETLFYATQPHAPLPSLPDPEILQMVGFPGIGVDTKHSIDAWEWRILETPELEEILDSLGNMGLDERIDMLLEELEKQEEAPEEGNLIFQEIQGFDNESVSLGSTIYDPPAFWIEETQTIDSGLDQRMVNLPVYHENVESINSEQLEFENWMDLHQPGYMAGLGQLDDDTSSYAPESGDEEPVEWWQFPQEIDFPLHLPDPPEPHEQDQEEDKSSPCTPVHIHPQGCVCMGCNRFSPLSEDGNDDLSFPVDMEAVSARLRAIKEQWLLEIDVDEVHRMAEIEEREIIREHRYLEQLQKNSTASGKGIPTVNPVPTPLPWMAEHSATQGHSSHEESDKWSEDTTEIIDVGLLHHMSELEEEKLKKIHNEWLKRASTFFMVQNCIKEKEIDDLENLADEILKEQDVQQLSPYGDLIGRERYFPYQPP